MKYFLFGVVIVLMLIGVTILSRKSHKETITQTIDPKVVSIEEREFTKFYILIKNKKTDSLVFEDWVAGSIKSIKEITADTFVDKVFFETFDSSFFTFNPKEYYALIEISKNKK